MRQALTIATTALVTAVITSWGTSVILAQSMKKADFANQPAQVGTTSARGEPASARASAAAEEMPTDISWSRWPSLTDF